MKQLLFLLIITTSIVHAQPKDFLAANIDKATPAYKDFFQYANGGWIKRTPIPASESGWGIGNMVQEEIYNRILAINQKAAATTNAPKGSAEQKIGDFWRTAMDTVAINKLGLTPLAAIFASINNINSINDVQPVISTMHQAGLGGLFGSYVAQDDKNSEANIQFYSQGGLGMPNREYYFKTDERTLKVQAAYKQYITTTLTQLNKYNSKANLPTINVNQAALEVYAFELLLATASRKLEDLRDPYKNYNKMTLASITALAKSFNFVQYAKDLGVSNTTDSIIVGQPEFYTALGAALSSTPISTIQLYLKLRAIVSAAPYLDDVTYNNLFTYRKVLSGATTPRPRWKRVLDAEEGAMGELLGQLFAKAYFNQKAKKRYTDMVEAIRTVYATRIQQLTWMSPVTKVKALEKLQAVTHKVGYPNKWKSFATLSINKSSYMANILSANKFWYTDNITKLGKPVDRTIWDMTPQTYNAYYNPSNNEIVLPAGIFAVPGIKDEDLDDAFVYGYAGASTIGHEITHGFDDQGRQYDAKGNLADWWTKEDGEEYIKRAQVIINQFNQYIPVDTLHINGEATQGENIADLGGLILGLDALKKTKQYKEGKPVGGLTPLQRYFLGYAYGWLYQVKKERLANQVMTDVHSPAKERVNGPMVNIADFYKAFNIQPNHPMYVAEANRVSIW